MSIWGDTVYISGGRLVRGYTAFTSAQSGISYTDGLAGLTDEELNKIAAAISNNPDITNTSSECWVSGVNRHISVGDTIEKAANGTKTWRLMGFNHYKLDNPYVYGNYLDISTSTGKAGLLFEIVGLWGNVSVDFLSGGTLVEETWVDKVVRTSDTYFPTYITQFPATFQAILKDVELPCAAINKSKAVSLPGTARIMTVVDKMFLPSAMEVMGPTTDTSYIAINEGERYAYYALNTAASARSRANKWWTRSPGGHTLSSNRISAFYWRYISASGSELSYNTSTGASTRKCYLAPCFCI